MFFNKAKKLKRLYTDHLTQYDLIKEKIKETNLTNLNADIKNLKIQHLNNLLCDLSESLTILRNSFDVNLNDIKDFYFFRKLKDTNGRIFYLDNTNIGKNLSKEKLASDTLDFITLYNRTPIKDELFNLITNKRIEKIQDSELVRHLKKALINKINSYDEKAHQLILKELELEYISILPKICYMLYNTFTYCVNCSDINNIPVLVYLNKIYNIQYHYTEVLCEEDIEFIETLAKKFNIDIILIY